jgi:hypothetical protein
VDPTDVYRNGSLLQIILEPWFNVAEMKDMTEAQLTVTPIDG